MMNYLSFLIKPASSMCNLKCTYCFYHDISDNRSVPSYGVMNESTMKKLIDFSFEEIADHGDITYAFQGGEPTIAKISYFESFIEYVNHKKTNQTIHYSIQTNGTLVDESWISLFKKYDFLVGISLDAYESNHNYYRNDSYASVMSTIKALEKSEVRYNILCVLSNQLAKHPSEVYAFFKQNHFKYIQFIPCLDNINKNNDDRLEARYFYSFYKEYFDLWYQDMQKGNYQSVTLFDNLILMIQDQAPQQCGTLGFCSAQFVIEANGTIYPCDFYVLDEYCCGNVIDNTMKEVMKNKILNTFLNNKKKISKLCMDCHYQNICHGGCKYMNHTFLETDYCGYQYLLYKIIPPLIKIRDEMILKHQK